MVLERAFPRKTEKTRLARAGLNSFPQQIAAPAATRPRSRSAVKFSRVILYRAEHTRCTRQVPTSIDFISYLNRPIYMSAFDRCVFYLWDKLYYVY